MITKGLLNASISGIGALHRTSVFPCGIFQCKKGINQDKGDPNYDLFQLALKSTSLRLYPNYANCDNSLQKGWVEYDRKRKQEVLDSLSSEEQEKLFKILQTNKSLADKLMVHCEDKVVPNQEELPFEMMSTMGKRIL